jgi:hypothetical protein
MERFEIIGWIYRDEFLREKELKTWPGYEEHPMWVIHKYKLQKPEFLVNIGV